MPRFFFDLDDARHLQDDDGIALADAAQVEPLALRTLADIARDKASHSQSDPLTVTVRDEVGQAVFRATLTIQTEWIAKPSQK